VTQYVVTQSIATQGVATQAMKKTARQEEISLSQLLKGNTNVFVLSVLKEGPSHGYAISFEIARRSNSKLDFKQGTLYPLLHELERGGLISSEWEESEPGKRRRRVYRITDKGLGELETRLAAWQLFNQAMYEVTGVLPDVERA
jgi:PadR family transcriptional regulator PadR